MLKFIHAADIHLDSPLKGLERYEGAPVEEIRGAARRAFENLIQLAIDEQVAFVLIAGDFYDGDWPDYNTGFFFVKQVSRLLELNIPVFLIAGNHDAQNRMTRSLQLPEHVKLFSANSAESFELLDREVVLHGQSFATQKVTENLAAAYPAAASGAFNIGLLHTCATSQEHERYAPCSLDDLRQKGYDYWALGHVHQRQQLEETPWIGFSGNLQGRHIRETGPKGCQLVTVQADHTVQTQFVPLDVLRWERAIIDVSDIRDEAELFDRFQQRLETLQENGADRLLAVRAEFVGHTAIDRQLQAQKHALLQELRSLAIAQGQGAIWLEKIKLETTPPREQTAASLNDAALGELQALLAQAVQHPDLLSEWNFSLADLQNRLPGDLKPQFPLSDPDWLRQRLHEAEATLLGELLPNSPTEDEVSA